MEQYQCKRCGYAWMARGQNKPKSCPACKQYRWDTPRVADNPCRDCEINEPTAETCRGCRKNSAMEG